jgi:hypothetical protein
MEPRREQQTALPPSSGKHTKREELIAPAIRLERPFRIERLEERIAPACDYFLKMNGIEGG